MYFLTGCLAGPLCFNYQQEPQIQMANRRESRLRSSIEETKQSFKLPLLTHGDSLGKTASFSAISNQQMCKVLRQWT